MNHLSDLKIRNLKPRKKMYKIRATEYLYIVIHPSGVKKWSFRYKKNGKDTSRTIGIYPSMTITKARAKRDELLDLINDCKSIETVTVSDDLRSVGN